jgi:tetratricopeptide (TPR) repeat protein
MKVNAEQRVDPQRRLPSIAAAALFLASASAHALKPDNITPAEMALIPKYCPDTNTFGYGGTADNQSPNAPKWIALMGKGFYAVHHYCWASIALLRAERPTVPRMEKQAAWKGALNDMQYVIDNSPANFVLLPEIYTKMGEVALKLNSPREAEGYLMKAVALKRDYWPAYFRWGEYLKGAGQNAEAKRVTEEGLSYSPDSKPLQALLKALGGDPRTVVRKNVAQDPAAPNEAVAAGAPAPKPQ